eukprot:TRINITY_DN5252_c0_g1_i2.p1 TRINITY_DN5252_c0_g1~~TRINITY_DN5252_c0_g1_i2.p1  ORF type:complete len:432 (-),score=48.15 TRINITY_DN5252_c0_g1_i2:311-1606(-)
MWSHSLSFKHVISGPNAIFKNKFSRYPSSKPPTLQITRSIIAQYQEKLNSEEKNREKILRKLKNFLGSIAICGALMTIPIQQVYAFVPIESRNIEIFKQSTPAVVNVTNLAVRKDAFSLDVEEIPQGMGSGIIWDDYGHIVTNFHVVNGAQDLIVTLTDGREYPAVQIGVDQDKDIAVLQVQNKPTPQLSDSYGQPQEDGTGYMQQSSEIKLQPLKQGSSNDLQVGQIVYAIGNPFGLDHTLTTGIISGTEREISSMTGRPIQGVIQTDAAINPGNSGGPLIDSTGRLIGMNTAIYSASGTSAGVGFAIPIDIVKSSVSQIIQFGKVTRPIIGIALAPEMTMEQLRLKGVLILNLKPDGPAAIAGLKGTQRDQNGRLVLGDIIVGVNGSKVAKASDLYRVLDKCAVGDVIALDVLRDNSKETVSVTLASNV